MTARILPLLLVALVSTGCATARARHITVVSVVSVHSTLTAIDDMEGAEACGLGTAPAPPLCVPHETHQRVSDVLATAFDLDAQLARTVKAWPAGAPAPAEIPGLLAQIARLADQALALLPDAPWKQKLVTMIGGTK